MPRRYESRMLARLQQRIAGVQSIDTHLDLGPGITVKSMVQASTELQHNVAAYNTALAQADAIRLLIKKSERTVRDIHERALAGVALLYGKDSIEYQKAGGKKKSEHKAYGEVKKAKEAQKAAKAAKAAERAAQLAAKDAKQNATTANGVAGHA